MDGTTIKFTGAEAASDPQIITLTIRPLTGTRAS
jgi:hypothetical protein